MMMTADGNDMRNWDCASHLLPTKVKTSLISSELPLLAEKPVLVASLAMAGPQTNLKRSTFHIAKGKYSLLSLLWFDLKWWNFCKKNYSHRLVHVVWSDCRVKTHIFSWVPQFTLWTQQQPWNNFPGSISIIMATVTIIQPAREARGPEGPARWER